MPGFLWLGTGARLGGGAEPAGAVSWVKAWWTSRDMALDHLFPRG